MPLEIITLGKAQEEIERALLENPGRQDMVMALKLPRI